MKLIRTSTIPGSLETFCKGFLKELKDDGYDVVAISSPEEILDLIADREGVRTIAVPMERHISPLKDLKSLFAMIRVLRKEKPDIIHSITPKAGLITMIAAKICRVPVRIHTFTGLVFPTATGFTKKILILTDRITCACATHIIPEGEGVKNDLQRFKITRKPLNVLGFGNIRGIDLEWYNPELPEVLSEASKLQKPDIFTFIFVGRLVGDKGINELVGAFSRLQKEYPACRLILVGGYEKDLDPLKDESVKLIESNPSIEAVGRQNDVRPWLAASDAFVFPSYREGFPNVVIEAGAMGLASIVTDINGSREIIVENKNGVIISPRNEEQLFQAMLNFVKNSDKVKSLAGNAREMIATRYEQSFVRNCQKQFYKDPSNR